MASYGAVIVQEARQQPESTGDTGRSRRFSMLLAAAAASTVLVVSAGSRALAGRQDDQGVLLAAGGAGGPRARLEMLYSGTSEEVETSIRTDRAHPYDRMIQAPQETKFINREWAPIHTVNPAPVHPYHAGQRPSMVHHRDFEHAPYGHQLPWEEGPEGALAKYVRRPDLVKHYRYVVNKDGVVKKWTYDLPLSEYKPEDIKASDAILAEFSPMPPPQPSSKGVAQALEEGQKSDISKSFRNVFPGGMFHDSLIDSRTGRQLSIPGLGKDNVPCPRGLFQCQDLSCVAHISYCDGCDVYPKPDSCQPIQAANSGWQPSTIGCKDQTDIVSCGTSEGNSLFLKGETVTGGWFGNLAADF